MVSRPPSLGGTNVRFLIPLALLGATVSLAKHQIDPVSAAEGLLLGCLSAAVLMCAAALERSRPPVDTGRPATATSSWIGLGACLALLILWAVPSGAARGTGLTALLLFLLLKAAADRYRESPRRLPLVLTGPLCLGLQGLFRPDLFLEVVPSQEVLLFRWCPAIFYSMVAALGLNLLARRHGSRNALLAGGVVVLASNGWSFVGAMSLLALAAGGLFAEGYPLRDRGVSGAPEAPYRIRGWGTWTPLALLLLCLAIGGFQGVPGRPLVYIAALALLSAASTWRSLGTLEGSKLPTWLPILGLLGLGTVALLLEDSPLTPARSPQRAVHLLALGLGLLPQAILTPRPRTLAAAVLAFLAGRWLPVGGMELSGLADAGLSGALAFLALGLPRGRRGATAQNLWLGFWVLLGTMAAGYPWVRSGSLETFSSFLPSFLELGSWSLLGLGTLLVVSFWALENALHALRRPARGPLVVVGVGFALLAGTLSSTQPRGETVLASGAVVLTEERPRWQAEISTRSVRQLVLVSNLAFSADLPPGRSVALLRLHHPDGSTSVEHLRAGTDTAEWAVRRPDLAARTQLVAPPAWRVAAATDGPYFAQQYRSSHRFESEKPVVAIDVFRRRNLPADVSLTLFRVEVLP